MPYKTLLHFGKPSSLHMADGESFSNTERLSTGNILMSTHRDETNTGGPWLSLSVELSSGLQLLGHVLVQVFVFRHVILLNRHWQCNYTRSGASFRPSPNRTPEETWAMWLYTFWCKSSSFAKSYSWRNMGNVIIHVLVQVFVLGQIVLLKKHGQCNYTSSGASLRPWPNHTPEETLAM